MRIHSLSSLSSTFRAHGRARQVFGCAPVLMAAAWCGSVRGQDAGQAAPSNSPATPPAQPSASTKLNWMDQRGVDYILSSVPPPPAPGSRDEAEDLAAVLKAQHERTATDIAKARVDEHFGLATLAGVIGPDFTQKNYPVSYALLDRILQDQGFLNSTLQARFHRQPPYAQHPEIKNLFSVSGFSYPSAPVSESRILSVTLMELFRPKTGELANRDLELGQNLLNAGVIYPTDIIGGRQLAQSLLFVIHDTPEFQRDITRAKIEIAGKMKPAAKAP